MSAVATRLRPRGQQYVLCPEDGTWFRPLYTDGLCPLCGEPVAEEEGGLPYLMRVDGIKAGVVALGITSVCMCLLVLYAYFSS